MSDDGIILIEMLVALIVVSSIMYLLLAFVYMVVNIASFEHVFTKQIQINTLMNNDILNASAINLEQDCLLIQNQDYEVEYCIKEDNLIRSIDNKGYENIISDTKMKFLDEPFIALELTNNNANYIIPIWTNE